MSNLGIIQLETGEPIMLTTGNSAVAETGILTWRPVTGFARNSQLPSDFAIKMRFLKTQVGRYYLTPLEGADALVLRGFVGGLAILQELHMLTEQEANSYRVMWHVFQFANRMKEFQKRKFQCRMDLKISRSASLLLSDSTVLPPGLGIRNDGRGQSWTVKDMLRIGSESARLHGIAKPKTRDEIEYGLFEAAKLQPFEVQGENHEADEKIDSLVRHALYERTPASIDVDNAVAIEVQGRFVDALATHLSDGNDQFRRWLLSPGNSLIKQIAKRKKAAHGSLPLDVVRQVILDLGWQAYHYISGCLHAQMWAIQRVLPLSYSPQDEQTYKNMYMPHSAFAHLPLPLLSARLGILRPALLHWWSAPEDMEMVKVVHRILSFYTFMSDQRRRADRLVHEAKRNIGSEADMFATVNFEGETNVRRLDRRLNGQH